MINSRADSTKIHYPGHCLPLILVLANLRAQLTRKAGKFLNPGYWSFRVEIRTEDSLTSNLKIDETVKGLGQELIWMSLGVPGTELADRICFQSTAANPADIARDSLGLVHFGTNRKGERDFRFVGVSKGQVLHYDNATMR